MLFQPAPAQPAPPAQGAAGAPQQPVGPAQRFTGFPVSLDFQGADLRAVLRTFAEISGLNIVIDPTIQGTVDVALRDVPWDQALDIILRANRLGYVIDGTIVRIAPLTTLADEEAQRQKLAEAQTLAGTLTTITRTLSYARAELVQRLLEYQQYQETVESLRGWEEYRRTLFFRGSVEDPDDYVLPVPEGALNADALFLALKRILDSVGVGAEPVTAVMPKRLSSAWMCPVAGGGTLVPTA